MLRVVVCVSGGGTNLQAILDRVADGTIKNTQIVRVISNNPKAYALERARSAGVEGICVSPKDYAEREAFHDALLAAVQEAEPDLVVLAGFLVAIPPKMVEAFPSRIINIHPSLIPSFCGVGYYGLHVHEAALARGVKVTGATVHFVDEDMDSGPILLQKAVAVQENDTPEILQRRVMEEAEWELLPRAISLIAEGRVRVEGRKTFIK
ncbi:MAG: phosphoribosylglycinamide formyltransferase [Lachnospiraceae bacterium]|nr:phosphoribosylglycinamide formyltransferase [Lachnospiraceae bacterium]MBQ6364738.1 phosphoribosylglycinamide formyltransferase [Lachnospiraceae bacterium]